MADVPLSAHSQGSGAPSPDPVASRRAFLAQLSVALSALAGAVVGIPILAYLLSHLPRDLASLNAVLDALDRHSLASQRPLTLPLVREALQKTP